MAKYISLTFDDGPNNGNDTTMNDMLDVLEKNNIPASFFLIGNKITAENTKVIERAVSLGCDIQNHTWTHPAMPELTPEQMMEEYNKCDDAIIKITGKKPTYFRPPYIAVNDVMYQTIKTPFICGVGCEDWVPEVSADERYNKMRAAVADGVLLLLHVDDGNKKTLQAVERIIPELKAEGYTFVTCEKMFELKKPDMTEPNKLWSKVE